VVVIVKTNLQTHKVAHVLWFSSDLDLSYDLVIAYYQLRFQIEFNFRDAKQHWGLEDFMVVHERPVYNSANLALLMVNVSQCLMPDFSVVTFRLDFMRVSARYLMKAHRNQWFWKLSYAPKVPYRVLPGVQITWCKGQKPSY
jgi:putative transposase